MIRSGSMGIRILAIASVFLLTAILVSAETEYPMFKYDVQRTGNVTGDAPQTNQILWATDIGGLIGSSPIISNGRVFVSNWFAEWYGGANGLYCLNESTGEILWTNPLNGSGGASTAAVSGGKVFVGSLTGELYCINASTGETIWNKTIEHNSLWWGVASSPLVYEGKVFITTWSGNISNNGTLHVFDLDGNWLWNSSSINNPTFKYASPAAFENYVLFAGNESSNHSLFCLNISDWSISWRFNTSAQIKSTPAISNNTVIFATSDRLYAVNVSNGGELWNSPLNCKMSSPAVAYGKVYIGSDDNVLHCYDVVNNGTEIWNFTANGPIHSSPVVANNTVYFGTNIKNGTIYAVNATDGSLIWSYTLNPPPGKYYNIMSSPAVSDGILFIGADDGRVYAFSYSRVNITDFSVEETSKKKGQSFTARLNITTSDAPAGWYAVVVSGVNANGSSIAGIGTVNLGPNDAIDLMPVLIHLPPCAETGEYKLYAVIYRLDNYPVVLMDRKGPIAVTVENA